MTPIYDERIIAFVDILGFRDIIKQSQKDSARVETIYQALEFLKGREDLANWNLRHIENEEDAQYKGVHNFDISKTVKCTCFSDSIVVSAEVTDGGKINEITSTLIANLAYAGSKLLAEGIVLRGGLTMGKLIHHANGVIMGQGLIDAYDLETRVAKFPRIVLSDHLIEHLNYPLEQKNRRYPYHQYLKRFSDGCVGFHQLQYFQVVQSWTEMTADILTAELLRIKNCIVDSLDRSIEQPEIFQKYIWLKDQYNELLIFTENAKVPIRNLYDDSDGHNIHFRVTNK